jgi:hypothetical protein
MFVWFERPYRLMNAAPVESLHGSFGSTRIIVFNEAVVVPFTVELLRELVRC